MSYSDKLKDVRWQKMRLKILERDEFACRFCGANESTSPHVHHLEYKHQAAPWDYDENTLITLCEECHDIEYSDRKSIERLLLSSLRKDSWSCVNIHELACMVHHSFLGGDKENALCVLDWLLRKDNSGQWEKLRRAYDLFCKERTEKKAQPC